MVAAPSFQGKRRGLEQEKERCKKLNFEYPFNFSQDAAIKCLTTSCVLQETESVSYSQYDALDEELIFLREKDPK